MDPPWQTERCHLGLSNDPATLAQASAETERRMREPHDEFSGLVLTDAEEAAFLRRMHIYDRLTALTQGLGATLAGFRLSHEILDLKATLLVPPGASSSAVQKVKAELESEFGLPVSLVKVLLTSAEAAATSEQLLAIWGQNPSLFERLSTTYSTKVVGVGFDTETQTIVVFVDEANPPADPAGLADQAARELSGLLKLPGGAERLPGCLEMTGPTSTGAYVSTTSP